MIDLKELKGRVKCIVDICSEKHVGGESYFDELDGMIKNNTDLVSAYINYIFQSEKIHNIIASGEIGDRIRELQRTGYINRFVNIVTVNGGLRHDNNICEVNVEDIWGKKFVFLDDSYYSGKTANKVKHAVEHNDGEIVKNYVFYDGCRDKQENVESLYRYYY